MHNNSGLKEIGKIVFKKILSALMVSASLVSASPYQEESFIAYALGNDSGQTVRFDVEVDGAHLLSSTMQNKEVQVEFSELDPMVREYKVSSYDKNDKLTGQSVCTFNESQTELKCKSISGNHDLFVESENTSWIFGVAAT